MRAPYLSGLALVGAWRAADRASSPRQSSLGYPWEHKSRSKSPRGWYPSLLKTRGSSETGYIAMVPGCGSAWTAPASGIGCEGVSGTTAELTRRPAHPSPSTCARARARFRVDRARRRRRAQLARCARTRLIQTRDEGDEKREQECERSDPEQLRPHRDARRRLPHDLRARARSAETKSRGSARELDPAARVALSPRTPCPRASLRPMSRPLRPNRVGSRRRDAGARKPGPARPSTRRAAVALMFAARRARRARPRTRAFLNLLLRRDTVPARESTGSPSVTAPWLDVAPPRAFADLLIPFAVERGSSR